MSYLFCLEIFDLITDILFHSCLQSGFRIKYAALTRFTNTTKNTKNHIVLLPYLKRYMCVYEANTDLLKVTLIYRELFPLLICFIALATNGFGSSNTTHGKNKGPQHKIQYYSSLTKSSFQTRFQIKL